MEHVLGTTSTLSILCCQHQKLISNKKSKVSKALDVQWKTKILATSQGLI